jgi:branched-chain amino acid transport system permease protein
MSARLSHNLALVLALALPWTTGSAYVLHIAIMTLIFVVLVQSLNLVLGYLGLLSLATPAFFGIGAYVAALTALKLGWSGPATIAAAALAGVATGLIIGVPSLRVSRHSFVIVTLSVTLLLQLAAGNWEELTRGALGLANIPPPRLLGFAVDGKVTWYYFVLIFAVAAVFLTHVVVSSPLGRAMIAARDNEVLAKAVGIDVYRVRLFAFAVSGGLAGLGGALYAHYFSFIDPGVFGFSYSEVLLIMVILGGAGTLWGPVLGAVAFTALPEVLRVAPQTRSLVYGFILLAIVLYMPRGLVAWLGDRWARSAKKWT